MFHRLIIVFSIIIICSNIIAQNTGTIDQTEKDYKKFHETLKEETENGEDDTLNFSDQQVLHPAHLPDWFFNIPESDDQTIFAIGISDPGMEENDAGKLAELRAKSTIALLDKSTLTSMTDNFSNEKVQENADEFTTKYINNYQIVSSIFNLKKNFEIIERFFTSFNEAIVLVKYSNSPLAEYAADSIKVVANVYQSERQKYNKFEVEERYEINGTTISDSNTTNFSYSLIALNNLFEITSGFNHNTLKFPYMNFRYQGQNKDQSFESNNMPGNKLHYGLWKSYIETVLQEIIVLSQSGSVVVKQVGDDYTSLNKYLSREISEATHSFTINSININNNRLSVNIDCLSKSN